jgi:hypothetical protein
VVVEHGRETGDGEGELAGIGVLGVPVADGADGAQISFTSDVPGGHRQDPSAGLHTPPLMPRLPHGVQRRPSMGSLVGLKEAPH